MWPQALQLSRDECRAILRRLELESYSQMMNVLRAQGGLNETKGKLLEELRTILHISQERHRAEARRVSNDEQLATVAEMISGPNTWQEWSREGRRPYALLPRVAPQTALAIISKKIAAETAEQNKLLPYPELTAQAAAEDHALYITKREEYSEKTNRSSKIVTSDPFKMPDIPTGPRKILKRITTDLYGGSNKKRHASESSALKAQQRHQQVNSNASFSSPTTTTTARKNTNNRVQNITPKQLSPKKNVSSTSSNKRLTGASARRSGKRMQKLTAQQQQKQQLIEGNDSRQLEVSTHCSDLHIDSRKENQFSPAMHLMDVPQIAVSKKDITRNLSKLQIPIAGSPLGSGGFYNAASGSSPEQISSTTNVVIGKTDKQLISTPVQKYIVEDRQPTTITSTTSTFNQTMPLTVMSPPMVGTQISTAPQVMMLPQTSAASPKLRGINTAIVSTGSKLTAKKLPTGTIVSTLGSGLDVVSGFLDGSGSTLNQTQVLNLGDSNFGNSVSGLHNVSTTPTAPLHTPPAVIQIQSSNADNSNINLQDASPTQPKAFTPKIVPIILGAGSSASFNNGASVIAAGSNTTMSSLSASTTSSSLIKPLTQNVAASNVNSSVAGGGNSGSGFDDGTIIPITTAGMQPIFRKTPNIIRANYIATSAAAAKYVSVTSPLKAQVKSGTGGGPQILSNIKLPPAIIPATTGASGTITTTHQFLQQQVKNAQAASVIRPNIKICHSPNGKLFIQSANLDATSRAKLQAVSLQRGSTNNITNFQIIGPATPTGGLPTSLSIQKTAKPTTLTIGGSNLRIMPLTNRRASISAIVPFSKASTIVGSPGSFITKTAAGVTDLEVSKPNVLVIGPSPSVQTSKRPTIAMQKTSTKIYDNRGNIVMQNNRLITEDTPIDILNLPIIVESDGNISDSNVTVKNSAIGSTVTLLPNDMLDSTNTIINTTKAVRTPHTTEQTINIMSPLLGEQLQTQPVVALNATDWEMELDQATAIAAASQKTKLNLSVQRQSTGTSFDGSNSLRMQQNSKSGSDLSYEDCIVMESEDNLSDRNNTTLRIEEQEEEYRKISANNSKELNLTENLITPLPHDAASIEDTDHTSENMELDDDINNAMAYSDDVQQNIFSQEDNLENSEQAAESIAKNESLHDEDFEASAEKANMNALEEHERREVGRLEHAEFLCREENALANAIELDVDDNESALVTA